jgi:biotin operon repressor
MRSTFALLAAATTIAIGAIGAIGLAGPAHAEADWPLVERALGVAGAAQPGGVYRFGLPRSDLHVTLDGVEIRPALALGGWLAFRDMGQQAMVMGDLVLTSEEINPVMQRLLEGGIEITAVHNHLLRQQPTTMYMHVSGHGDPVALAQTLHAALALSRTPFGAPAAAAPPDVGLDTASLDRIIGRPGRAVGGVYQFGIPRAETIVDSGMEVPVAMGTAIAINFQSTGNGRAAITGDFVLTGAEVNPVLKALRENGIEVTAVHNHMLNDAPRLFFVHFWANDETEKLARGLRAALDRVNLQRS